MTPLHTATNQNNNGAMILRIQIICYTCYTLCFLGKLTTCSSSGLTVGLGICAAWSVISSIISAILAYNYVIIKRKIPASEPTNKAADQEMTTTGQEGPYAEIDVSDIDVTPSVYASVDTNPYEQVK